MNSFFTFGGLVWLQYGFFSPVLFGRRRSIGRALVQGSLQTQTCKFIGRSVCPAAMSAITTQVTKEITVPDEGSNGPTFAFSVFKAIAILPPDLSELNFFRNLGLLGEMCLQSERNALMSVHAIFSSRLAGFGPL